MGGSTTYYDPDLHGDLTDFLYGRRTGHGEHGEIRVCQRHGTIYEVMHASTTGSATFQEHVALIRFQVSGAFRPWFVAFTEAENLDPSEHGGHTLGYRQTEESQNPSATGISLELLTAAERLAPLKELDDEMQAAVNALEAELDPAQGQAYVKLLDQLNALDPQRGTRRWRRAAWEEIRRTQQHAQVSLFG